MYFLISVIFVVSVIIFGAYRYTFGRIEHNSKLLTSDWEEGPRFELTKNFHILASAHQGHKILIIKQGTVFIFKGSRGIFRLGDGSEIPSTIYTRYGTNKDRIFVFKIYKKWYKPTKEAFNGATYKILDKEKRCYSNSVKRKETT